MLMKTSDYYYGSILNPISSSKRTLFLIEVIVTKTLLLDFPPMMMVSWDMAA